jgi:carboxypeptidase Taq
MSAYATVEKYFRRISRLQHLNSLAQWDQAVMMPGGGAGVRGAAMAELAVVLVETMRSSELADALNAAEGELGRLGEWEKANLREARIVHQRMTAVDPKLVEELTEASLATEVMWRSLRKANDWKGFVPQFKKLVGLVREHSRQLSVATGLPPYEALVNMYEPLLRVKTIEKLFGELRKTLPPLLAEVLEKQKRRKPIELGRKVPAARQKPMMDHFMKWIGFDFNHGRLDESHHPFCGGVPRDVRLTTRYSEEDFLAGFMGVLHETGHARYEQNLPAKWLEQPVGMARGMAMHESQSLFVEMQIARSRDFYEWAAPLLEENLGQSGDPAGFWRPENLFAHAAMVEPGFIRVDADEVTYPAHVILRFEVERALIEGTMNVEDLPAVWDQKMREFLGLSTLGNDANGCMQDVHWPSGAFGYFPSYTMGAMIAAQLFAALEKQLPGVRGGIGKGDVAPVMDWLKRNVWEQGSLLSTEDLLVKVTGAPLTVEPFVGHLKRRYLAD